MLQININKKIQDQAAQVLKNVGMDLNSGIEMILKQIARTKKVPFQNRTINGFTEEQENEMLKEAEWAMKYGKRYNTIEEAHRDILGPDYK